MKKFLALFAVIAITFSAASAQDICLRGGMNLAKHIGTYPYFNKVKFGVNLGATVDFELVDDLYLRPGLFFTMKGGRKNAGDDEFCNQNYFEIPVDVAYKIEFNRNLALDIQAGPYFAVGFCGKNKNKTKHKEDPNYTYPKTFKNNAKDWQIHRFDLGLNFGIGMDVDQFYFGLGYDLGLLKLYDDDHHKRKNSCLMFNFGYYL